MLRLLLWTHYFELVEKAARERERERETEREREREIEREREKNIYQMFYV
jgi:hypothetical protein